MPSHGAGTALPEFLCALDGRRTVVPGLLLAAIIAAVSIVSSSAVFAETAQTGNSAQPAQSPLTEYYGGIKIYDNTSRTLEENVQMILGNQSALEKAKLRLTSEILYIAADRKKLDFYNRYSARIEIYTYQSGTIATELAK